ncbi:MAG: NADH:flavin oxidoreductase [Coriobacteriaceae bacterium]|nr:NADH:flavin oxidoreductase [Olsenella sp.]RRF88831.1 MAG: NADH:flavin oxidoreductase [Coriobacteriaceae bacterium]
MDILEPLEAGRLSLPTRIVVPPMATQSTEAGLPGGRTIAHYEAFAQNPLVGLVITEHSFVDPAGRADPYQMSFATDDVVPAQERLTAAVNAANPHVRLFAQLNHARLNTSEAITGSPLVSASSLRTQEGTSRALSAEEIARIGDEFAAAARRVREAGYDGVEIHSAHGYLLNQFFSPLTNFRTDAYGPQSVQNRTRFLVETVRKVRAAVGDDFPVSVRLGGSDYAEGGSTIADAVEAARILEREGVDLVNLSGGLNVYMRRGHSEPGWFADMSAAVRRAIHTPVMLTGGVRTPDQAQRLLDDGAADLIGVGRAMLRNPRWGMQP